MANEQKRSRLLHFVVANLDTVAIFLKYLLPASITGAVVGWATWFTGIFQQHAPASWIYATVIGALIGAVIAALLAYSREKMQQVRFRNTVFSGTYLNPLDTLFTTKRVRIADLSPPIGAIIEGKTFVDCEIMGPANVVFEGCHFHGNSGEVVDAIIIKPRNDTAKWIRFSKLHISRMSLLPRDVYGFRAGIREFQAARACWLELDNRETGSAATSNDY